jgi:uncharacterized membrane protein YqjE
MEPAPSAPTGLLGSLRSLGDDLLASVQDRIELFAIELQQEKLHLIRTLIWVSAIIFTGVIVVIFGSLTLIYFFWDSARLTALATLTGFYAVAFGVMIILFRRSIARRPSPFAATLQELCEDRTCIRQEK